VPAINPGVLATSRRSASGQQAPHDVGRPIGIASGRKELRDFDQIVSGGDEREFVCTPRTHLPESSSRRKAVADALATGTLFDTPAFSQKVL
jgi:hypothetical protein